MTLSDSAEAEGLLLQVVSRGRSCTQGGTLAVQGGDGSGFSATFSVVGGGIDQLAIIHHGEGYTHESGLMVVVSSGGVGCEDLDVVARLRAYRLSNQTTTVTVSRVGKDTLMIANGTQGPFYDFSLQVVSDAGSSDARVLEHVAILAFPARLASFAVVAGSVTTESASVTWSPPIALRLSVSLDAGRTFVKHPASPFSLIHNGTLFASYINTLGVQERLTAGAAYILRACPFDASRALAQQQRADGCSLLQVRISSLHSTSPSWSVTL